MENYVRFELLGYRWVVKEKCAFILKEQAIPLVLSGEPSPLLHVVKKKFLRDSLIFSREDFPFGIFVKYHKYNRTSERMKTLLLASRAKTEWAMGERMQKRGLPVAEPLGFGERRNCGRVTGCVSFQRAMSNAIDLRTYIDRGHPLEEDAVASISSGEDNDFRSGVSNELLNTLGELVCKIHAAGFRHPDFHAGNVLIESGGSHPRLCLIDLHAVRRVLGAIPYGRMADLAKLVHALRGSLDESQFMQVLAGYRPEASETELRRMLRKIFAATDSLERRRIVSRSKRCLKTSGSFVVERSGERKIYRNRDFSDEMVVDALRRHKEVLASEGPGLVKRTSKSALTLFTMSGLEGRNVYVKEFENRGFKRRLETLFYVHRGKRGWKAGHMLKILGVPCSEPLALVEERKNGMLDTSYLIMEEITGADRLNVFLLRHFFRVSGRLSRDDILQKRRFIRVGARYLREFHSKNIYHKDLSEKNLLVSLDDEKRWRFFCVDVDSVLFPWRLSVRRRIKNLAQLNGLPACVTTADKIRFYKEYFGLDDLTPMHKTVIRTICWLSRRRMEHWRHIDERLKKEISHEEQAYEDIASF